MIEIEPLGDTAIRVYFGDEISETTHNQILQFTAWLSIVKIDGIVEWVPAYTTVAIYYRPEVISYEKLTGVAAKVFAASSDSPQRTPIVYEIPVLYGGETGEDLSYIANYHHLTEKEVIALHSGQEYLIYMMGFVPGFPYLGGLPAKLAVPRLEHPRPSVLAGAVGIGGNQTGIYPSDVPSGWRILGITPVKLFDITKQTPVLFAAGNYIKFYPIDGAEFSRVKQLTAENKYKVKTYLKGEEQP
ncbi:5-oxoprolinase subunit PxpB [Neobacillus niacini]|uniref:5-oxoprolinase subunit PxpB n=1 Tax=Neobacillus niacini TaxID=86668 RepID=UPI0021CAF0D1|nr:5-oxoprolinase subunit PxpB [Neobacillus niacini]MCM3765931.1 5-oxoprolinase subunit PxpB [Neobacillus niacini]